MGPSVLGRRPLLNIASGAKAEKGDAMLFPDTSRSSRSVLNLQEPGLSALNHRRQHWYAKLSVMPCRSYCTSSPSQSAAVTPVGS